MIEEAVRPEEMAEVDEAKREFMKKFGKYAATAPVGMYLLMSPTASKAQASGSSITCHEWGEFDWGTCKVKHIKYEAEGTRNERCEIDAVIKKPNHVPKPLKIIVENKNKVTIYTKWKNGQYRKKEITTLNKLKNKNNKYHKILDDLDFFS